MYADDVGEYDSQKREKCWCRGGGASIVCTAICLDGQSWKVYLCMWAHVLILQFVYKCISYSYTKHIKYLQIQFKEDAGANSSVCKLLTIINETFSVLKICLVSVHAFNFWICTFYFLLFATLETGIADEGGNASPRL